ncbi:hypothetical protein FOZ63_000043 [Perkinsus olseni]|uniref:Uncharacterized protein n=1 Tax=Perkinsus olseni TaxID=32597 RepID=A0A7J6RDH6_PEROL|nr:hypothetical protein FOZ62_029093 [Perkinsus olseni]KAF4744498.1 hypothetical protein FOZ63_000043 [Perkinsus olseni]
MLIILVSLLLTLFVPRVEAGYAIYRYTAAHFEIDYTLFTGKERDFVTITVKCVSQPGSERGVSFELSDYFVIQGDAKIFPYPYDSYSVSDKEDLQKFKDDVGSACGKNLQPEDFTNMLIRETELDTTFEGKKEVFVEVKRY